MSHLHFGRAVPIIFRRFPPLICRDLLGKTVKVPQDLKGQLNLLVVGFKASHYKDMDSWISFARTLKKDLVKRRNIDDSQIETYRLVIRHPGGVLLRWWTDERLRFAVGRGDFVHDECETKKTTEENEGDGSTSLRPPEQTGNGENESGAAGYATENMRLSALQAVRSKTLVCFTNKNAFVESLQLADAQRAYIFLVDREGEISWCEHEHYSANKEIAIRELLQLPTAEEQGLLTSEELSSQRSLLPPV
ncbi:hypothetical protein, conserved [Eimeria necatrix]|uniref:Uncharacterized protein n=1 Tax=Eimeria necatrix TaxID=51315 RepID=U6MQN4_9EIME|nr:hypothetical protein, conserved [Eimeria necatrix]CDJ63970.1 hypothetical protein, conserved [Eimeria necatrix]